MNNLQAIRARAQATADREGRPVSILNLNTVGAALYVIRDAETGIETARGFVEIVRPQAAPAE